MEKRKVKTEKKTTKKTKWETPVLVKLGDADRTDGSPAPVCFSNGLTDD